MMNNSNQYGWLFRFASNVLKYFLLGLFGMLVALLLSGIVEFLPLINLLVHVLEHCFMKSVVVVFCVVAVAVVTESIR